MFNKTDGLMRRFVLKNPPDLYQECTAPFSTLRGKCSATVSLEKHFRFFKKRRSLFGRSVVCLAGILLLLLFYSGCQSESEPILEAEGYIVGGYHCLTDEVISTPYGTGRTYLVETTSSDPEVLLVFGVPAGLYDIPAEWLGYYSFPEEQKRNYKIRFRYRNIISPRDDNWRKSFLCTLELPNIGRHYPNVVVISATRAN